MEPPYVDGGAIVKGLEQRNVEVTGGCFCVRMIDMLYEGSSQGVWERSSFCTCTIVEM